MIRKNKLQKDDIVRCIDDKHTRIAGAKANITKGKLYRVRKNNGKTVLVEPLTPDPSFSIGWWFPSRFEVVA